MILSCKFLSVLLVTFRSISITSALCDSSAVGPIQSNTNRCSYPACSDNDENAATWNCVHDSSFCTSNQRFVPGLEVLAAGKVCSCTDILNFPSLIGTCVTNGVYSPMLTEDDCVGGGSVCGKDELTDKFLVGDTDHPYTACDLKCDFMLGHESEVAEDTYKGCSFPTFEWTVASESKYSTLQDHQFKIIDNTLFIGGTIFPLDPGNYASSALNFALKGPFDASNPTAEDGSYVNDIVDDRTGVLSKRCTVAMVDKTTGEPKDIVTLNGTGACYINSMDATKSDGVGNSDVILAGGHHSAEGVMNVDTTECIAVSNTMGAAYTVCDSGQTTIKAHNSADTAFVFLMETDGKIRWLIQPWLSLIYNQVRGLNSPVYETSVTGVSVDENEDVYITGYRIDAGNDPVAMISKHSGTNGGILWLQEFPGVEHVHHLVKDEMDNALYVTLNIPRSMSKIPELNISCNPTSLSVQSCSVLTRVSSRNGAVQWARYAYGFSDDSTYRGEVKLAHPMDGSYVYAAFSGVGSLGPSDIDLGTSYSGCKHSDGTVTPEIDPMFLTLTESLNPTICSSRLSAVYFDRRSDDAIPAHVANTPAQCGGYHSDSHCLVKYHKLTGLPIWGSTTPNLHDFQPLKNGIIITGSIITGSNNVPTTFDTVKVSGPVGLSMVYQSKLDLDGKGLYVQSIIADRSSVTRSTLTQDPVTEDIYIGFSTKASKTYLGPGAPVGFVQDLELESKCQENDPVCNGIRRITVAKLGTEQTPYCINSCGNSEYNIAEGTCFIDQVCYTDNDTGARIGMPCNACASSVSQTEWTPFVCSPNDNTPPISTPVILLPPKDDDNKVDVLGDADDDDMVISDDDDDEMVISGDGFAQVDPIDDTDRQANTDGLSPISMATVIVCAIAGLALALVGAESYSKKPKYNAPQFFPAEGDFS